MRMEIVVVGSGIAGLAAAQTLRRAGLPVRLVDSASAPGGSLASLRGENWLAESAAPYFRQSDRTLYLLVRQLGLETDLRAIQGAVVHTPAGSTPAEGQRSFGEGRVVLAEGFDLIAARLAREVPFMGDAEIGALKWDATRKAILMRDQTTGRVLRDPRDRVEVRARGLVLAVPAGAARRIIASTAFLEPLLPYFQRMGTVPGATIAYILPQWLPGWSIWEPDEGDDLVAWASVENAKVPGRAPEGKSLFVARLSRAAAQELSALPKDQLIDVVFGRLKSRIAGLPTIYESAAALRREDDAPAPGCTLQVTAAGVPTTPEDLPFGIAGDYIGDGSLEATAASGVMAAHTVIERLA